MKYIQYTAQAISLLYCSHVKSQLSTEISNCFACSYEGYGLNAVLE